MQINCGCKTTVGVFEDAIFSEILGSGGGL